MSAHGETPAMHDQVIEVMEAAGRAGLTISVCCGPSREHAFTWSVTVLSRTGEEFEMPFEAVSFKHAVEIAQIEIVKRGWLRGDPTRP